MKTVYIFADHQTFKESAPTFEDLKALIESTYEVNQFTFSFDETGHGASSFDRTFVGVK